MTTRHLTTAVTLAALCVIVVLAAVIGFNALFAPLPGADEEPAATASPTCQVQPGGKDRRLRSSEVLVNVYNAGSRAGLAGATIDKFRARGFQGGLIGNAPQDSLVRRVQVWIAEGEEDAGRLVARQLGRRTPVVIRDEDLADGVEVVVGNRFRDLVRAPRSILVKRVEGGCS